MNLYKMTFYLLHYNYLTNNLNLIGGYIVIVNCFVVDYVLFFIESKTLIALI